jgi:hypothetical protein
MFPERSTKSVVSKLVFTNKDSCLPMFHLPSELQKCLQWSRMWVNVNVSVNDGKGGTKEE